MGLFDKIKDLFTDEEEVYEDEKEETVKIKEIKKEETPNKNLVKETAKVEVKEPEESKLPTFMREKIEEEEKKKEKFNLENNTDVKPDFNVSSRVSSRSSHNLYTEDTVEIPRTNEKSFKFPVEFDDSDFVPSRTRKVASINDEKMVNTVLEKPPVRRAEPVKKDKKVADIYKDKKPKEEEHKFKATPIISPIYGVLDKNYSKDQIKEVDEASYEIKRNSTTKNVDFETVRKKAYGSLVDDIKENLMCENCELLKEAKEEQRKKKTEDNLVYDMLKEDEVKEVEEEKKDITFGAATENYYDYGVPYEAPKVSKKYDYLDAKEEKVEKPEVKIVSSGEEIKDKPHKKEVPPVKSSINLLSTLKKSMGEEVQQEQPKQETKTNKSSKKDLELTDDLFNLIDSMYDERND